MGTVLTSSGGALSVPVWCACSDSTLSCDPGWLGVWYCGRGVSGGAERNGGLVSAKLRTVRALECYESWKDSGGCECVSAEAGESEFRGLGG